jgi:hypothetical protein
MYILDNIIKWDLKMELYASQCEQVTDYKRGKETISKTILLDVKEIETETETKAETETETDIA